MAASLIMPTIIAIIAVVVSTSIKAAAPPPQYIQFRPAVTKGVLYRPDPELYPGTAIPMMMSLLSPGKMPVACS